MATRGISDPNLVPELIQLVDDRDPYATMALNALAYSFTPESSAKIREVASDVTADRELRERAIAPLAVTKDREMLPMLMDLANGPDQRLGKIAFEVIKVLTTK
jgi:HEAT repeat protein